MHPLFRSVDRYFLDTATIVRHKGSCAATYAFFLRHDALYAVKLVADFLHETLTPMGIPFTLESDFSSGDIVPALTPLFYLTGDFASLAPFETLLLQKVGLPCVVAFEAYQMALVLPDIDFIAMGARHCSDPIMDLISTYGVSVGSLRAKQEGAKGYLGSSTDACAGYFNQLQGLGTMPHALVGYCGSTLEAAQSYHATFPDRPMTVLVDYFGQEITDSLAVCQYFASLAHAGHLHVRLDTHGGRFVEGLSRSRSRDILADVLGSDFESSYTPSAMDMLMGEGVSVAAVYALRQALDAKGFSRVGIVVSSGFSLSKCRIFAQAKAPIFRVGTGSYFPNNFSDTYATADIVAYDGQLRVKKGREFLLPSSLPSLGA